MEYPDGAWLDGLQRSVDRLAVTLGRSVAIDDVQGRLVVSSGHFGEEDPMRIYAIVNRVSDPRVMAHFKQHDIYSLVGPGRIPANPELDFKARVCIPIRERGILFGHLFLIDDDVAEADIAEACATVEQIGDLMHRRLVHDEDAQRRAATLVRDLVSGRPTDRAQARHRLSDSHSDPPVVTLDPVSAVVVQIGEEATDGQLAALRSAVEVTIRDRFRGVSLARVGSGEAIILLFGRAAGAGREVATQIRTRLQSVDCQAVAGVGPALTGPDAAATSYADAAISARACRVLPGLDGVAGTDDLGGFDLLLRLPEQELTTDRYPRGLRTLLAADGADVLIETLETYLDCAGDASRTTKQLMVHRSTLYYRLGRIEEIAHVDLRDGGTRLALHLGLKLRRLITRTPDS